MVLNTEPTGQNVYTSYDGVAQSYSPVEALISVSAFIGFSRIRTTEFISLRRVLSCTFFVTFAIGIVSEDFLATWFAARVRLVTSMRYHMA